jgi:Cys-tRNA synthase (O-phospho-L-seryl-tRNA:Cys-tRNA synthase)
MTNLEANVRKLLGVLEAHYIDSYDCDRAGMDHCDCLATAVEGVERALRDNSEGDCPAHGRETLAIGVLARFASYVDAVEAALLQTEVGRNAYPQYAANLSAAGTALKDVCIRAGRSLSKEGEQ